MLALMLSGTEQSTAAERKISCLILFLIIINDNKYQMRKSQKVPELALPCFDFYATYRDEKYL